MIKSMTGYARASKEYNNKKIVVEVRTLNSKQADISLKMPPLYKCNEIQWRNMIISGLERGKIDLTVSIENSLDSERRINHQAFKQYYQELELLASELGAEKSELMRSVLVLPDIMMAQQESVAEQEELDVVGGLIALVIENVNRFRETEGKSLECDILTRLSIIKDNIIKVEEFEPTRVEKVKQKLSQKLQELSINAVDENRLEQELIYYIEKLDINEEKTRLRQHINYFTEIVNEESSQGKKLGFVCQEIGREINTLGSKSQEANMQKIVVQMKDELEKIKEQVLNVL